VLAADRQLALQVPVADLYPLAAGRYLLSSEIPLPAAPQPGSRPLLDALAPFADLGDCPLDPAQLLLDCAIDALDPGDPLDCVVSAPSATAAALEAERGAVDVAGCRAAKSARGAPSLDKLLSDALKAGGTGTLGALPGIAPAGRAMLAAGLELASELELLATDGSSGSAVARHSLTAATFRGPGTATATVKLGELGLPQLTALPVGAKLAAGWRLMIDEHGFSLRLGLVARRALGKLVLAAVGLPESSEALAAALFALVHHGGLKGCAALDALACDAARLLPSCLADACKAAGGALASRLDSGFLAIAVPTKDLSLKGTVEMKDKDGDLAVDELGSEQKPGVWDVKIALGPETASASAAFVGRRPKK
jgi:hypothetical protein